MPALARTIRRLPVALTLTVASAACTLRARPGSSQAIPTPSGVVASRVDTGRINGAAFRIEIPANWHGGLVMYAHGYGNPGYTPFRVMRSLAPMFAARGFAIAASDYRVPLGWSVAEGIEDTEALRQYFIRTHGRPRQTFIVGHSMGAQVTTGTIEQNGSHYDGALPLCGMLEPSLAYFHTTVFDQLVTFDYLFSGALPQVADGLSDRRAPMEADSSRVASAIASDRARAERLARRFLIEPEDLSGRILFLYRTLRELQHRANGNPFDNHGTIYLGYGDDLAVNRGVRRYAADTAAIRYLQKGATTTGRITKPVLAVHTLYDAGVPAASVNAYRALTDAAGAHHLFQGYFINARGHCTITGPQHAAAFDLLRTWVETGVRPVGGELR